MDTQWQWSDLAILRTTPALLSMLFLVALWASQLAAERGPVVECVRWYRKSLPTFSDALALVRHERLCCKVCGRAVNGRNKLQIRR